MNESIYAKGRRLAIAGGVEVTDDTSRALYFRVRGDHEVHYVRLMRDNTFNCTCPWGSLKGAASGAMCSHVVAAVIRASVHAPRPGAGPSGPRSARHEGYAPTA